MVTQDVAVLIVGAGPVGLAAAAESARHGLAVRVIDELPAPNEQSRAVALQARTLESLHPLGVVDELLARGRPQNRVDIVGRAGRVEASLDFTTIASTYAFVLDLPQPVTEGVLRRAVESSAVPIEYSTSLRSLVQDEDGVTATVATPSGESTIRAMYVIGADGARGRTRHLAGLRYDDYLEGDVALLADVEADVDFSRDVTTLLNDERGERSIHPMPGDRVRLGFAAPGADPSTTPTLEEVQARCLQLYDGRVRVREAHWLSYYRSRSGLVPRLRADRILLAGDSAHVHPPAGGQGMNLGIQDAIALVWRLALVTSGDATPVLLDDYAVERHAVAAEVVDGARRLSRLMLSTSRVGAEKRRLALFALGHLGSASAHRAAVTAQLTVDYSPLGTVVTDHHHLAGRRLPPVTGITHDGVATSVEEIISGPVHTVIVFRSPDDDSPPAAPVLRHGVATSIPIVDGDGGLAELTGHRSGMIVVRPDGYVAANVDARGGRIVSMHLDRLLRRG
ncbi:FAD-dependent monooxygenase [Herbiconiux sp. YIM B11900]|uniref:FAD-dependent monooxygenase n=1 Tax=Herbiconiux sp. YIM B11900 TaxID=3404131 RepID=UPI003F851127